GARCAVGSRGRCSLEDGVRAASFGDIDQQLFDARLIFDAAIELEPQLGPPPQAHARADLPAQERCGPVERPLALATALLVTNGRVENADQLQVRYDCLP